MEKKGFVRNYEIRTTPSRLELPSSQSRDSLQRFKRQLLFLDSSGKSSDNSAKDELTASEDKVDEKDEIVLKNRLLDQEEKSHGEEVPEASEDGRIVHGKRKRYSSLLYDSDESEDSGMPPRKAFAKYRCVVAEDESSEEGGTSWGSPSSENVEDSCSESEREKDPSYWLCLSPIESSETESESMSDFTGEQDDDDNIEYGKSEKQPQQKELLNTSSSDLLTIPCLSYCDHYAHFKRAVKALLINALDDTFLPSLHDGTPHEKSALDLLFSLYYLDDCFIQPRLMNLLSRSCWKDQYKERVDAYPHIHIAVGYCENKACEACELSPSCGCHVLLYGKLYNSRTLEVDHLVSDDKQVLKVDTVCADRTRVYHRLKHFRYKLYVDCSSVSKLDGVVGEAVTDKVEWLLNGLEDCGWILKRYNDLEDYLNDADKLREKTD